MSWFPCAVALIPFGCVAALESQLNAKETVADVATFGAVGDGAADDTAAIMRAIASLPPKGGTVFFPSGTYGIGSSGIMINRSNILLKGAAPPPVLRRVEREGPIIQSGPSSQVQARIHLDSLWIDGNRGAFARENFASISLYGSHVSNVTVSNCRFFNSPAIAFAASGVRNITLENSTFDSPGAAQSTAVHLTNSCRHVSVRRNHFRYIRDGIIINTGDESNPRKYPTEHISVRENQFDLGWWTIKELIANDGPTVTYSSNSLVDEEADFKGLLRGTQQNIRLLTVKHRGEANYSSKTLQDAHAQFASARLREGDIVRVRDMFGIVSNVSSPTSIEVEQWLSQETYEPRSTPPAGASYTVYGVFLGEVRDFTQTTVTTTRWWDRDGNSVTPPAGCRYEILSQRPNYALHAESGARQITVSKNIFRRGWADQISIWGDDAVITDNTIEDGQDMGITLHGRGHRLANNRIHHQGAGGIWATCDNSVIERNHITDSQWVNNLNDNWLGDIIIDDGNRNHIIGNVCERMTSVLAHNGIVIAGRRSGSIGNIIRNNITRRHLKAGIRFTRKGDARISATVLRNNDGKIVGKP